MKLIVLGAYMNYLGFIKKNIYSGTVDLLLVSDQEKYSGSHNADK